MTLQSFLNVANCEPQDHVHRIRVPELYMITDPFAAPPAAHRVIFGRMGGNAEFRVISRRPGGDLQHQLDKGVSAQTDHFRDNIDSETHITETRLRGQQYVIADRSSNDRGASMPTPTGEDDLRELLKLNEDYLLSDQNRNVARYEEFLAPEFTASLPNYNIYDRRAFLGMISKPRPFTDLKCHDVQITLIGEIALVHARMALEKLSGQLKEGRQTDDYMRRDGKWWCLGANVISENIAA